MKWSVGTKIGAGYGLAFVALITFGVTSYLRVNRLFQTTRWVDHEEIFLTPYADAIIRVPHHLAALRKLTADNKSQQDLLGKLDCAPR
jgi:CHASE3 domain sensor protein